MKIQVLGCWAPYPPADQACSGYLLNIGGKNILIDLGHGAFSKLQVVFDYKKLDAVFISHLHQDHCADLSCLRHALLGSKRLGLIESKKLLPLYIPSEPLSSFDLFSEYGDAFEIILIDDSTVGQLTDICGIECRIFPVEHPIPTYGVSFREGDRRFVYSSDTAYREELIDIVDGADIFLCEASLMEKDSQHTDKGHLTSKLAGILGQKAKVQQLILTHFWPEYDLEKLAGETREVFTGSLEIAAQFKVYLC